MANLIFPKLVPGELAVGDKRSGKAVGNLQAALQRLGHDIAPRDLARKELGTSTAEAVKAVQEKAGLPSTGAVDAATLKAINANVVRRFFAGSKPRTAKLQSLLAEAGATIDEAEIKTRTVGDSTRAAIRKLGAAAGTGEELDEGFYVWLRDTAVGKRLEAKPQVAKFHETLLRALHLGKVSDIRVDVEELRGRKVGPSTQAAVKALQAAYGLKPTGTVDAVTFDRINSIAASVPQPVRQLKPLPAVALTPVRKSLRLNMSHPEVQQAQSALAFLGYRIEEREFKSATFGKTTREAVRAFERARRLPDTGHVSRKTMKALNAEIVSANPDLGTGPARQRMRGSVRDDMWRGIGGARIELWETSLAGAAVKLSETVAQPNGFYDLPYDPPRDPSSGQLKPVYQLEVRSFRPDGAPIGVSSTINPTAIAWANFTAGDLPYRGPSIFEQQRDAVERSTGVSILQLHETDGEPMVTTAARAALLDTDDVMQLVLAYRVAAQLATPALDAAACYVFIGQNLPAAMPGDLLGATEQWALIDSLVQTVTDALVFTAPVLLDAAFDQAIADNLVPIATIRKRDDILAALAAKLNAFAVEKPILSGNGTIKGLLDQAGVPAGNRAAIIDRFLEHRSFDASFWSDLNADPAAFGGAAMVAALRTTTELGHIAKNFQPMMAMMQDRIDDPAAPEITAPKAFAKFTADDWIALIDKQGGAVPDGTDGDTLAARKRTYAATLQNQAEQLFPTVALIARIGRNGENKLPQLDAVETLLDVDPDFQITEEPVDALVARTGAAVSDAVLGSARALQRVQRVAPKADSGAVLVDKGFHSSAQILRTGRARFVEMMTADKRVEREVANGIFERATHQHLKTIRTMLNLRADHAGATPAAVPGYVTVTGDLPDELSQVVSLKTLFGSLDYCKTDHCESVYGPAAYLADLFRFLDQHPSEIANKTVLDLLIERRPDLPHIKLSCANTETPLPYTDLVLEVLENWILPAPPITDRQTTRTAAELRAAPEHTRPEAYDLLRSTTAPLTVGYDLWQAEARLFLEHLGMPRAELMTLFQTGAGAAADPSDLSIAAEGWNISSLDTATIVATGDATAAKQRAFWALANPIPQTLPVSAFLRRAGIGYDDLLNLLAMAWINPPGDAANIEIERPDGTCDLDVQLVTNLASARLDKMHRLLRFKRHVDWNFRELDLLLRAPDVGGGNLDADALVRMRRFATLQKRLKLDVEQALALFGPINTEAKIDPVDPPKPIKALWDKLFRDPSIHRPLDPAFDLPLAAGLQIADSQTSVLAAFAITEADLALLQAGTANGDLSIANLSAIARHVFLARGLRLSMSDLLSLKALVGGGDPFADTASLTALIDAYDRIGEAGSTIATLEYLLTATGTSAIGLRAEVAEQQADTLRLAATGVESDPALAIVTQVASLHGVSSEIAALLVNQPRLAGTTFIDVLLRPDFLATEPGGAFADPASAFPDAIHVVHALHKMALLVRGLSITAGDLEWLLANAADANLLAIDQLPVSVAPGAPLFPAWARLARWTGFSRRYPEPEGVSLRDIFDLAMAEPLVPEGDIQTALATLTQWDEAAVTGLATALDFQHAAAGSDYADIDRLTRMEKGWAAIRRTGVSAEDLRRWAERDVEAGNRQQQVAGEIRHAAKAKYDEATWLGKSAEFEDTLRKQKRDALITFAIARSQTTAAPAGLSGNIAGIYPWNDAADLLNFFCIDVEMGPCQLTSRIKQAISTTQMFVQRCLLGIEKPRIRVTRGEQDERASPDAWSQWEWMKQYRIWEANRKVFLYPENWIEPELRDDKSPFFTELENELLQTDMTDSAAQEAFEHYLEKVHEVARLEIVGTYYELDDLDPRDDLPPDVNVLHVIGRTRTDPATYFYRRFDCNYNEWSPWERIDLDITGDQVMPVVYNRRLYLFWLMIIEKPQKLHKLPAAELSPVSRDAPSQPNQLEIQLCWSARKGKGWTAKRVSKQKLIHPWQRPHVSYSLKPRYKSRENQLWVDLYISQTREFNDRRFWDSYRHVNDFVTSRRFSESARPWHSSSFVFDGEIIDLRMKPLNGLYHVMVGPGTVSEDLEPSTSLEYVRTSYGAVGEDLLPLSGGYQIGPRLPLPDGMRYQSGRLANRPGNAGVNVLENGTGRRLMQGRAPFELVASQHSIRFDTAAWGPVPFLYQDRQRSFFIRPEWQEIVLGYNRTLQTYKYRTYPSYHPYSALFLREARRGLDKLLNRKLQTSPQTYFPGNSFSFNAAYNPESAMVVAPSAANDRVDFDRDGAYGLYNWEIFFHAPLLIACRLTQNQRFDEAMRWFHYIFDPTGTDGDQIPQRYWVTRPFYEMSSEEARSQRITELLKNIGANDDQLTAWKNNPFKPFLIARYRPTAFQMTVVMKYIDNLIAWGDQLFRRDTIESINEATTLYILAYELLGARPVQVAGVDRQDMTYAELVADHDLDAFANQQVEVLAENFAGTPVRITRSEGDGPAVPTLTTFYFSIPNNSDLLGYWDTVEDRLFKIRNCMNIEGVKRQLALFEPPIDPALLVKAAAAGIDLSSALAAMESDGGPYRFRILAAKAVELCGELQALGDKLLVALEKRDSEALALLRSGQERSLQQAMLDARVLGIEEAQQALDALENSRLSIEARKDFYGDRDLMNGWEIASVAILGTTILLEPTVGVLHGIAAGLAVVPEVTVGAAGVGGSPQANAAPVEGKRLAESVEQAAKVIEVIKATLEKGAELTDKLGAFVERKENWDFQAEQAELELGKLAKDILTAKTRIVIAEKERDTQDLRIEQAVAADEYMSSKYTGQQLYDWHVGQLSTVYFAAYQLAFDMAQRAERCFRRERGDLGASFIQFGHWDSLKKGLMSGERLSRDIRRMEAAFLQQNNRDLELTKNISLAQVAPLQLLALKQGGSCTLTLPEWLFDMDYPGHIVRRVKAVSLSIPAVAGPYTNVNCTLSLTNHGTRVSTDLAGGYGDPLAPDGPRFVGQAGFGPVQKAIATSHGQNDFGMFELRFDDERYLPFEGAGAASVWQLDLPAANNQFDLGAISDVILHLRYTARASGSQPLINAAKANLDAVLPDNGARLFLLDQDFAGEWYRFLNPDPGQDQQMAFTIKREHLPFYARTGDLGLLTVKLMILGAEGLDFEAELVPPGGPAIADTLTGDATFGEAVSLDAAGFGPIAPVLGDWTLKLKRDDAGDFRSLAAADVKRAYLVVGYSRS